MILNFIFVLDRHIKFSFRCQQRQKETEYMKTIIRTKSAYLYSF